MEAEVVVDPQINNGKPTVRGTRIAVQTVMEFLGAGDSIEGVPEAYPSLTRDEVISGS